MNPLFVLCVYDPIGFSCRVTIFTIQLQINNYVHFHLFVSHISYCLLLLLLSSLCISFFMWFFFVINIFAISPSKIEKKYVFSDKNVINNRCLHYIKYYIKIILDAQFGWVERKSRRKQQQKNCIKKWEFFFFLLYLSKWIQVNH